METRLKRKSTEAKLDLSDDDLETDGFVFKKKGRYRPRKHEVNTWGPNVGNFPSPEDVDEAVYQLLKRTGPETKWRGPLKQAITTCVTERCVKKCLAFFQACVDSSIKVAKDYGFAGSVPVDARSAPWSLSCEDWTCVLSGLTLETTNLLIEPQIANVDVSIGKATDPIALKGFLFLVQVLQALSWSNLDGIRKLTQEEGILLYENVSVLSAGYGIDVSNRRALETVNAHAPGLMTALGFSRDMTEKLQWKPPGEDYLDEFKHLMLSLHGLYRPTQMLKSIV